MNLNLWDYLDDWQRMNDKNKFRGNFLNISVRNTLEVVIYIYAVFRQMRLNTTLHTTKTAV